MKRWLKSALLITLLAVSAGCLEEPIKPERNDWSTIWISNSNQTALPRILLVGDSIANGYYDHVEEALINDAYLGRYTTSKFIGNPDFSAELKIILQRYQFEIIHINNGLHGWDYTLEEYEKGLENLVKLLKRYAPDSTIIWCMTTPIRVENELTYLDKKNKRVVDRNQTAKQIMTEQDWAIHDMYQAMIQHPEYYRNDGLHFNDRGKIAQGEFVTGLLQQYLPD